MEFNKRCCLICAGSELLRGNINTHTATLSRRLAGIGLELSEENTFADDLPALTEGIRRAMARYAVVIVTGGLGPTFDDVTREAAARATRRSLHVSKELLRGIQKKFKRAHTRMPPANARQAELLEGAVTIPNSVGTAPGQWLTLEEGKVLILLPGPPSELHPMLERFVLPQLQKVFPPAPTAEAHLHCVGVPESIVDQRVRPIIARAEKMNGVQVRFTILAHLGLVDFDIFVSANSKTRAERIRNSLVAQVRQRMGSRFYGMDSDYPLEKVVADHFRRRKWTLAVAESCTGGGLAKALTDVSGASDYFLGGVVSYHNDAKQTVLGVPKDVLKKNGAVSAPVASAMAQGVLQHLSSHVGLSITGIAGPTGGTSKKPVGLVYMGLSIGPRTRTWEFRFSGTREAIRQRAILAALDLLRTV